MSITLPAISRAHTELLGIQPQTAYPEPQLLEHIDILADARYALLRQMYLTGRWQWGVVFGAREAGLLTVRHFAPNAPRFENPERQPFRYDQLYLLGYADAVLAAYGGQCDWAGYWLVRPNSQTMTHHEEITWLHEATRQGIVDSQTPVLTAGYQDGELVVNAYKAIDGDLVKLTVSV